MGSVVLEVSEVSGSVGELHVAFSNFKVQAELSLINGVCSDFYS